MLLRFEGLPRGVIALGLVSLCMDASSEMVHSVMPVFLVTVLGASAVTVGLLEGIAEATAAITKVFSGTLSDRWQRRKSLIVAGYGLAALTKPLFPLADSVSWVLAARFLDRIGKGIRGAPRDALLADLVSPVAAQRGLRPAPVSRLAGRLPGTAARHWTVAALAGRPARRAVGRGRAGLPGGRTPHFRR